MKIDKIVAIDDAGNVIKAAVAASKPFWRSKTFWFNVLGVGMHYTGAVPASVAPYVVPLLGTMNIILRGVTTQPVTITK